MTSDANLPPDRLAARALAHQLLEQSQVVPIPDLFDRLAGQARAAGWGEVEVVLQHCRLLSQSLGGLAYATVREASDAMLVAAEGAGDEILIALALAARAVFVVHADHPDSLVEDVGDLLSRAVAMLDDAMSADPGTLGARATELPAAFVECGQAFHRLGQWEIEEEMYARAAEALELPLPPPLLPVRGYTRRALVINRMECGTALACALLEVGERAAAGVVAAAVLRPDPQERADVAPLWGFEMLAVEHFLDAIAGRPGVPPADLNRRLASSTWSGYRACLLLASAVIADDRGDPRRAAGLAERAVGLLDDYKPSIAALAMQLAARTAQDPAALRYARHQVTLRWQTRLAVHGALRSRLAATRVLRQGEQLSRQAYVDALTGCANRHAETRHLARLRRRGPLERIVVVLVDVDHFKAVNDTYGHAAGDEVLRAIGAVLQAAIRAGDLAVRRGGDEFMLLVDLPPGADEPVIADGVVRAVTGHHWPAVAAGLRVSVSAGQAVGAARDVDHLIAAADENLYRAKAAGRGQAVGAVPT